MSDNWALALCTPGGERVASRLLDRLCYPHLWFKQRGTCVVRGRVVERLRPAFPRYMWLPWSMGWDAVRQCSRLTRVVSFGDVTKVPAAIVDGLVARCGGGDVLPVEPEPARFAFGQRVRIGGYGAAAGQVALFQYSLVDGHAAVLLPWLGAWVPASIAECDLEPEGSRQHTNQRVRRRRRNGSGRHRYRNAA